MRSIEAFGTGLLMALLACSSSGSGSSGVPTRGANGSAADSKCTADSACTAKLDTPLCDVPTGACVALPAGHPIGWRDGSAGSVDLTEILKSSTNRVPVDLQFHPDRPTELWVVNRSDGSVTIITKPDADDFSVKTLRDPAADHFMVRPPALAFGAPNEFATCGDWDNAGTHFTGPALFSADLAIFAKATPTGLGSHIDMLHSSPFCRGIAHVSGSSYWVFNSFDRALDRYTFNSDHGPGNDDHADGEIVRYATGQVLGLTDVPSHLAYDAEDGALYVADTGNKRIGRLDTTKGTPGGPLPRRNEPTQKRFAMDGTAVTDLVPRGTLEMPCGIELREGLVYATDHATSRFYAFDKTGKLLRQLETGLPAKSLAGFTFGPNGKVYFVDMRTGRVLRLDPR